MYKNARGITFILALLIVGGCVGWFVHAHYLALSTSATPSNLKEIRENSEKYKFINPLLFIDTQSSSKEYTELKNLIEQTITPLKKSGELTDISVYFRNLNTGKWVGINEDKTYEPGSMLKVLTLITYLKKAETDPSILTKKLPYKKVEDPGQHYQPESTLPDGYYSTEKLLGQMIVYSDNTAALTLLNESKSDFFETYDALELPPKPVADTEDFMSPKAYSRLFRTLYNSSYLQRNLSEQALFLLTKTSFKKGLVAGVPGEIAVAHKFGENSLGLKTGSIISRELHDCGIVYYPEDPYFICIMTKGGDFEKLESIISTISKTVYGFVDTKNIKGE